jgi:hypothetical protein
VVGANDRLLGHVQRPAQLGREVAGQRSSDQKNRFFAMFRAVFAANPRQ